MNKTTPTLKNPLLRYYGGKWRLASWIIRHFPPHVCYVEPYGGAGSVLLRKPPSEFEIYNDLDSEVVNFFRVLREQPEQLRQALYCTPFSREEYEQSYHANGTPLERARRMFILSWQGYGGPRKQMRTGWKVQRRTWESGRADQLAEWNQAKEIIPAAERFSHVQIEHDDALKIIRRFDTSKTLFYCDPPYPADTRNAKWCKSAYSHEMGGHDHVHLINLLNQIDGMAILSSYPNALYTDMLSGWVQKTKTCQTMNGTQATEVIYLSPKLSAALEEARKETAKN
jgi:DNA adenine methylase